MNGCPTREQLQSFLSGSLADGEEEDICGHVDGCAVCQRLLDSIVAGASTTDRQRQPDPLPDEKFLNRLKARLPPEGWLGAAPPFVVGEDRAAAGTLPVLPGYEVLEELGRGGMGIVYKARQVGLNRLTAVKMIDTGAPSALDALNRFRSEAEAVAALHHPNIIQIHEIGASNGRPFFSMEYAAKGTLRQRLKKEGLSPREAAAIVATLARAIQYAHDCGIVHRDLKPANVLLMEEGTPKIADFGLAKRIDDHMETRTQTGRILGTPSYMAPEQASGKANRAGPSVDIYALGAILYELVTGRPPFQGESFESTLNLILNAEPVAPRRLKPGLPRDLETVCLKCLEKEPKRRYLAAGALADDLDRFRAGRPVRVRPVGPVERSVRWCRRNPGLAAVWGAFVGALVLGLTGVSWKWLEAEAEKENVQRAERKARDQRDSANAARDESKRTTAIMLLDKGIALAGKGNVAEGMFWMLESLRSLPEEDGGLRRAALLNLAAWQPLLHSLTQVIIGNFSTMALAPDGSRLVTGSWNGDVQVWDARTGQPIGIAVHLVPHEISAVAYSRDGAAFLACGDTRIQRFDAATGQPFGSPLVHPEYVHAAAFSPDGLRVASACEDGIVRLWDLATGKVQSEPFHDTKTHPVCIAISPDGATLAVGTARSYDTRGAPPWPNGGRSLRSNPAAVHLITLASGARLDPLAHPGIVNSVSFSGDSRRLLTTCYDGVVRVWDVATGSADGPPLANPGDAWTAAFTPDGTAIITGYGVGHVGGSRWWNAATHHPLAGSLPRHPEHNVRLAVDANGRRLATLASRAFRGAKTGDFAIRLWQIARPYDRAPSVQAEDTPTRSSSARIANQTRFSPNGKTAVCWNEEECVARIWDLETGLPHGSPIRHPWNILSAAYSPDGARLAISSRHMPGPGGASVNTVCQVIEVGAGRLVHNLPHSNWVNSLAFSPDGTVLYTGGYDRCIHVWDLATGQQREPPLRQRDIVHSIALGPDGRTLAVAHHGDDSGAPGTTLWDLPSRRYRTPELPPQSAHFSPDGKLVVNGDGKAVRLWNVETCSAIEPNLTAASSEESRATFSSDGSMILTDGDNGTARLWSVAGGRQLGSPLFSMHAVTARAFSPDSRLFVLGYADGTAQLLDVVTHHLVGPPVRHGSPVHAVAFAPDGKSFYTVAGNEPPRAHPVPNPLPEEDVERFRQRLEVVTGLTMPEGGLVRELSVASWRDCRDRLIQERGSAAITSTALDDRAWHDARARDAEDAGDGFAALWHLDRLQDQSRANAADAQPATGSSERSFPARFATLARKGRIHSNAGRFERADAEYAAALHYGRLDNLLDWYRQRVVECMRAGKWMTARWYLDRAIARAPAGWEWYAVRADVNDAQGRTSERDVDLDRALALGADGATAVCIGGEYARRGQWDKALACFELARARGPLVIPGWSWHAMALLQARDTAGYGKLCRELVGIAAANADLGSINDAASPFVIGPNGLDDYEPVLRLLSQALEEIPGIPVRRPGVLTTYGAALYRAGRYRDSIAVLRESYQAPRGGNPNETVVFLALAHQKLGETEEAQRWLELVTRPKLNPGALDWNILELHLLLREVEQLNQSPPR